MSARKSVITVIAICAWAGAIALAITHADTNKIFSLLVAGAVLLTLSLMYPPKAYPPAAEGAAKTSTSILPKILSIGFRQGWRARGFLVAIKAAEKKGVSPRPPELI